MGKSSIICGEIDAKTIPLVNKFHACAMLHIVDCNTGLGHINSYTGSLEARV